MGIVAIFLVNFGSLASMTILTGAWEPLDISWPTLSTYKLQSPSKHHTTTYNSIQFDIQLEHLDRDVLVAGSCNFAQGRRNGLNWRLCICFICKSNKTLTFELLEFDHWVPSSSFQKTCCIGISRPNLLQQKKNPSIQKLSMM